MITIQNTVCFVGNVCKVAFETEKRYRGVFVPLVNSSFSSYSERMVGCELYRALATREL
jgi:hypothetical protein